ncbi:ATP-binding protein [Mucilaginibacter daejeonensis]
MLKASPARRGLGLTIIKSKIKLLNGTVNITSSTNRGTSVEVKIPYRAWA